jgi:AcrR family transcriptional regulator
MRSVGNVTSPGSPRSVRLSRADRRAQLLDAAAALVVELGSEALTMERLGEWAGVSKALPYSHFGNADDVLVALYYRYIGELGDRVLGAIEQVDADDDLAVIAVRAYFDAVLDLGPILGVLSSPGSRAAALADTDARIGPDFVTRLLVEHFDVPAQRAQVAAPIVLGALVAAASAWGQGRGTRTELESISVEVLRSCVG